MIFARSIAILLLSTGALMLPAGCSKQSDQDHVREARDFISKEDFAAASIELKNALQINAENGQAWWLLGQIQLQLGNAPAAEKALRRAADHGVMDEAVRPLLAQTLLDQGKYNEVLQLEPDSSYAASARAEILAAHGGALLARNELEEASGKIAAALSVYPDSLPARVGKARLLNKRGKPDDARRLLEAVLETDGTYAPAWALIGDIESAEKEFEKAVEAYSRAIKDQPHQPGYRLNRAAAHIDLRQFTAARSDLERLKKRYPRNPDVNHQLGLLNFHENRFEEARDAFTEVVNRKPDKLSAVYYLGVSHFMLGDHQQADKHLSRFVSARPGSVPGRKLMTLINLARGDYKAAEQYIRPVAVSGMQDALALNMLANALMKQGKTEEGLRFLEKAAKIAPDSALTHVRLGAGLMMKGDMAAATEQLESALELDPDSMHADMLLILSLLQQGNLEKALVVARSYRERSPDEARPYNMLGMVHLAADRTRQARAAFNKAREITPGDVTSNYNLANLAIQDGDTATARRHFEEVLKHQPMHMKTLINLAVLDAGAGDIKASEKKLRQAINKHPDALEPRIYLGRLYLDQGNPEKVQVALGEMYATHNKDPAILTLMGLAQLAQDETSDAAVTLKRLVSLKPDSAQSHYLLAKAYAKLEQPGALEQELITTLDLDPSHLPARLGLTRLQLHKTETDKAKNNLAILKEQAPDSADVRFLEAELARASGSQDKALNTYEMVFEQTSSTTALLSLSRQKWDMGDREESLALIRDWVDEHPNDITARLALASAHLLLDETDSAIREYSKVLDQDATNIVALNNLAWQLRNSDPEKALNYAEKANRLAPDSPTLMDTLAMVLHKNGETERALRMSRNAVEQSRGNPTFVFHRALILRGIGRTEEAGRMLSSLLENTEAAFPERRRAEQILAELRNQ